MKLNKIQNFSICLNEFQLLQIISGYFYLNPSIQLQLIVWIIFL